MTEFTDYRHNPGIDPALHVWGWEIPVYLFLGGLVAGLMIIAGARLLIFARSRFVIGIGLANMVVGVALGIYTGILLSTLSARPLWNSAILGPLFLFSGLSTAAALLHGILVLSFKDGDRPEFVDILLSSLARWSHGRGLDTSIAPMLQRADNSFLTIELGLLMLLLVGLVTSGEASQRAAQLLLSGPYATAFWVFVIGLGILLPLLLQFLELQHRIRHSLFPAALVLFGGLVLRIIFVAAGQASHLAVAVN